MDIKDYIHFYIGQDCMYENLISKIQAVGCFDMGEGVIITYQNPDEESGFYGEWEEAEVEPNKVKPILRKIESMTEEEAKLFFKLPTGCIITYKENRGNYIEFEYKWEDDKIKPNTSDGLCYSSVGLGVSPQKESFKPEKTRWLLGLGFDLWGLIDANLAIDASSLPQQNVKS